MTVSAQRLVPWYRLAFRRPRIGILLGVSAASLATLAAAAVGVVADPRLITGAPAWLKPLKFAVSIAVYCATLAWLLTLVQGHRRLVRTVAWATGLALALELALIVLQAMRGQASHYNISTPFNSAVFVTMGATLPAIYGAAVVTAALLTRQRGLPAVLRSGIRGGLLVCLLGMAQGSLMLGNSENAGAGMIGAHTVGGADGGPGLPLTGWSTEHGDLRVAHFVGLHALQLLPLLAWLLQRYAGRLGVLAQVRLIQLSTAASIGVVGLLTWQAQRGLPLLRPDAAVLSAVAIGTAIAVAAVLAAVAQDRRTA
jgi:hypothetical protein